MGADVEGNDPMVTDDVKNRSGLTRDEAEAFVGTNTAYYLEKWRTNPNSSYKGWNWAAMFFGVEWMAWRRMYRELAILLPCYLVASVIAGALAWLAGIEEGMLGELLSSVLRILLGVFGNTLYRNKALHSIRQTGGMDETGRLAYMRRQGGTSAAGVVVVVIIELALVLLPVVIAVVLSALLRR